MLPPSIFFGQPQRVRRWKVTASQPDAPIHKNRLAAPGGFNPFEKYDRQNGNLPQIGMKIKDI